MSRVHVVGGGLAGLSAALAMQDRGARVTVYEAGPALGGRCRSYFDRALGLRIDNGNHLVLSGNTASMAYLDSVGARGSLTGPGEALYPFVDVQSAERWTIRPSLGRIPWWMLRAAGRVPGTRLADYMVLLRLLRAGADATVADVLAGSPTLYRRLLEPLAVAALNTPGEEGLACLLARVVTETLARGGGACIPGFPRFGLSESFIDPAVERLRARGAEVLSGRRIAAVRVEAERAVALEAPDGQIELAEDDRVVLAVPPWIAAELMPGLRVPDAFQAILNVHYRMDAAAAGTLARAGFIGIVGGTAEWVFVKPGVVSVTVSAANRLVDRSAEEIAALVWPDVRTALDLAPGDAMPPVRVVKERRATFAATAAQESRRPSARVGLRNLALGGDWTATGLPATIEGAIRSGHSAADVLSAA